MDDGTPKRARLSESQGLAARRRSPPMSDLLKKTLANHATEDKASLATIEISAGQLESMAARVSLGYARVQVHC